MNIAGTNTHYILSGDDIGQNAISNILPLKSNVGCAHITIALLTSPTPNSNLRFNILKPIMETTLA